jgi:hypothetical protein
MMLGHGAMMWVMGGAALVIAVILILGAAAPIKYLFFRSPRMKTGNRVACAAPACCERVGVAARSAAAITVGFGLLMAPSSGHAKDGDLQRALLAEGCVQPHIKQIAHQGSVSVYEANCLGSSHKVLGVICVDGRCLVSQPPNEPDEKAE